MLPRKITDFARTLLDNNTQVSAYGGWPLITAHCSPSTATASDVHPGGTQFGPDKAVDDDPETRWATSGQTKQAWLEVERPNLRPSRDWSSRNSILALPNTNSNTA